MCFTGAILTAAILESKQLYGMNAENDEALKYLSNLAKPSSDWIMVSDNADVVIHKRTITSHMPPSYLNEADKAASRRHECVRGVGVIDAPPEFVFKTFRDNNKLMEFNSNIGAVKDLYDFPKSSGENEIETWTKVAWSKAVANIPFVKARDFYSIVSFSKFRKTGSYIIINRPAYLSKDESHSGCVRGSLLLSGNIIEPYGNQTRITQVIQINPGGSADSAAVAWLINKKQLHTYVFIKALDNVVRRDYLQFLNDSNGLLAENMVGTLRSIEDRLKKQFRGRVNQLERFFAVNKKGSRL
jgi:hypothetical protein